MKPSNLEQEFQIEAVAKHPVISTHRNGTPCYSSHEYQDLISEAEGLIFIDEWEFMLHLIAPDMRRLLIPVSDQKAPEVINQTVSELDERELQRLKNSYFALWQTTDRDQKESMDDAAIDAVSRVVWFLQRRFQGRSEKIVMDYSAQTICLS